MEKHLEDPQQEIPGTLNDLHNLKKFWEFHKIPLPPNAMEWVNDKCNKSIDLTHDDKLHIQYLIAYGHCSGAEIFQDPIFQTANENAKKIVYHRQFQSDLQALFEDTE